MVDLSDLFKEIGCNGGDPLPSPNVSVKRSGDESEFTEEEIRGFLCNPVYAGFGPFPQVIPDELWIKAAMKAIEDDGSAQFLVNLLHVLRDSGASNISGETE